MPRRNFSTVFYWNIYMINNNIVENVIDILYYYIILHHTAYSLQHIVIVNVNHVIMYFCNMVVRSFV